MLSRNLDRGYLAPVHGLSHESLCGSALKPTLLEVLQALKTFGSPTRYCSHRPRQPGFMGWSRSEDQGGQRNESLRRNPAMSRALPSQGSQAAIYGASSLGAIELASIRCIVIVTPVWASMAMRRETRRRAIPRSDAPPKERGANGAYGSAGPSNTSSLRGRRFRRDGDVDEAIVTKPSTISAGMAAWRSGPRASWSAGRLPAPRGRLRPIMRARAPARFFRLQSESEGWCL